MKLNTKALYGFAVYRQGGQRERGIGPVADSFCFGNWPRRGGDVNLRTGLLRIIRWARLTAWPRLWQNLRSSRETELAAEYPIHVVCAWIGNSELIAAKHYLQVTEADFERAAKSGAVVLQNGLQQPAAPVCTDSQATPQAREGCGLVREDAICCNLLQDKGIPPRGLERTLKTPRKQGQFA
jgi:hypothetical protein